MTNSPFIFVSQRGEKGFDFSPWGGLEGFLEASKLGKTGNATSLKRLVPDLAHAVDMASVAISSLPFDVLDENGEVFDTSADWQNKLGGMPNPQRLIYLLASSLCGGSAYLLPIRTPKLIFDLQYCAPSSVTPYIDINGLQYFSRTTAQGKTDNYIKPKEIIYFWLPDSDVEIGPALNHPLGNATLPAQFLYNASSTMSMYGERGFVPITLLGAKGMPNEGERQKAEGFFDRLLRGGFNVLAKIVNSDALTLIKVGAGMDELKQSYIEITKQTTEKIAAAFGIPTALFMSDAAYASEMDVLLRQWYTDSRFVSIYQTIEETFNDQLLKQYKKKWVFKPETLDIFQEDETARASSLGAFVSAVTTNPKVAELGMKIMGYDLDEKQWAALTAIINEKEENAKRMQEQTQPKPAEPGTPQGQPVTDNAAQPTETQPEEDNQPPAKTFTLSADEIKDLALWYDRSRQWFVKGKGTAVDWECKHLREEVAAPIRLKLAEATSEETIAAAFNLSDVQTTQTPAPSYDAVHELAISIDKAVEAIKEK